MLLRRIAIALLFIGTVAGYANGIYSVTHRGERRGCGGRDHWSDAYRVHPNDVDARRFAAGPEQ